MQDYSVKEEFTVKIQKFFKENISVISLVLVCLVYIFYGIITIKQTGKTIGQIVADGGVSFLVGYVIKVLLNNQGISNGEKSDNFINCKLFYVKLLDEIAPIQHYLQRYCDIENETALKRSQTSMLRSQNIKYEDFINNNLDYSKLDKKQLKAIQKARNLHIHVISDSILLSDSQINLDIGKELMISKKTYSKKSNVSMLIITLLVALLFGYYGIDKDTGFNVMGAIWSAIQVVIYLALGSMQYFSGYTFMADTYRTALVRKANHLEKFKNMYNENPDQFKTEEEIEYENKKNHKAEMEELLQKRIHHLEEMIEVLIEDDNAEEDLEEEKKEEDIEEKAD